MESSPSRRLACKKPRLGHMFGVWSVPGAPPSRFEKRRTFKPAIMLSKDRMSTKNRRTSAKFICELQ